LVTKMSGIPNNENEIVGNRYEGARCMPTGACPEDRVPEENFPYDASLEEPDSDLEDKLEHSHIDYVVEMLENEDGELLYDEQAAEALVEVYGVDDVEKSLMRVYSGTVDDLWAEKVIEELEDMEHEGSEAEERAVVNLAGGNHVGPKTASIDGSESGNKAH
jgi:hypothetical protein